MSINRAINLEKLCKYISSEYGSEVRRKNYFEKHLLREDKNHHQEFDNVYDLFNKYGPCKNEVSQHAQAECVHRWIKILYAETMHKDYNFLDLFDSYTYIDGPGCFGSFESDEELKEHLRGNYKFRSVLTFAIDDLPKYKIGSFPENLSPSKLKEFIMPRKDEDLY